MEATIFDTSPKEALGFWPLIAAWVSLKKSAYAETGFCGSLGSFFFLPFFAPATTFADASVAGLPPPLRAVPGEMDDGRARWDEMLGRPEEEERDNGESTRTLFWEGRDSVGEMGEQALASSSPTQQWLLFTVQVKFSTFSQFLLFSSCNSYYMYGVRCSKKLSDKCMSRKKMYITEAKE